MQNVPQMSSFTINVQINKENSENILFKQARSYDNFQNTIRR